MTSMQEECIGCGWLFVDGGRTWSVAVWNNATEADESRLICGPCALAQHSWRRGRTLSPEMAHVSSCTNLILAKLRDKS
jgi:hypothetical protein